MRRLHQSQGDEGREDAEVAVREVDQTHDAEDEGEADGEESVEPSQKDPLQNDVDPVHALTSRSRLP